MKTFHRLVVNTLIASVTNNFLWFALTFWVYLETRSVVASSVIGGSYMLLLSVSALFFGTYVDHHRRKSSMLASSVGSLVAYVLAVALYLVAPEGSLQDFGHPAFWLLVVLVLGGAIAGNLRSVALSTTVTLLVPEDAHDKANGLVGTVNGVAFALTSVFSGLSIGFLGMGWSLGIAVALTMLAAAHLLGIRIEGDKAGAGDDQPKAVDVRGAFRAVRAVPGLLLLLFFTTFNNFLGGVFMALMDPYGLTLVSVETWGLVLGGRQFRVHRRRHLRRPQGTRVEPAADTAAHQHGALDDLHPVPGPLLDRAPRDRVRHLHRPDPGRRGLRADDHPARRPLRGARTCLRVRADDGVGGVARHRLPDRADRPGLGHPVHDRRSRRRQLSEAGSGPELIEAWPLVFMAAGVIGLVVTIVAMRSDGFGDLSSRYTASRTEPHTPQTIQA